MKQLYFGLILLTFCHNSHAAQASQAAGKTATQALAEKRVQYCQVLGVEPNASLEAINEAFRKIALIKHPDKNPNDPDAQEKFRPILEARDFLNNPKNQAGAHPEQSTASDDDALREQYLHNVLVPFLDQCDNLEKIAQKIHADDNAKRIQAMRLRVDQQQKVNDADERELAQLQKSIEDRRDQLIGNFLKTCQEASRHASDGYQSKIKTLMDKIQKQGYPDEEAESIIKKLCQQIEQERPYHEFITRLNTAKNYPWCSSQNATNLTTILRQIRNQTITNENEQELRKLEAAVAKNKSNYDRNQAFMARTDTARNFTWCSLINKENLDALWGRVLDHNVTDQDEQELRKLEAAVAQDKSNYERNQAFIGRIDNARNNYSRSPDNDKDLATLKERARNGTVTAQDEDGLRDLEAAIARRQTFFEKLHSARCSPGCSSHNADNLYTLSERVRNHTLTNENEQYLAQLEKAVAEDKINYDKCQEFLKKCLRVIEYEKKEDVFHSRRYKINALINCVTKNAHVTQEEQQALENIEADIFLQSCDYEKFHCGNSTEHCPALQELSHEVQRKKYIDDEDKNRFEQIKKQKKENFLKQCYSLRDECLSIEGSNNNTYQETSDLITKIEFPHHDQTYPDQCAFKGLQSNVQNTKYWKSARGKFRLWTSIATPLVLAFLHGYANNIFAQRTGGIQQLAFYLAPRRERLTALFALSGQIGLGIHLFKTFSSKYHSYSKYFHSVSKEKQFLAALAYLASIGIFQDFGERVPVNGNGWRNPMNSEGSIILNSLLANSSLCAASSGLIGFGLKKLLRI